MPEKHLHIVSFDIPYPPNYGGVIDVFYKIKTLHELGIKIHLHCIEYPGRERAEELNDYCEEVLYYPRKTGLIYALTPKPYIVSSRRSEEMISNLLKDSYPIIFEGLHSCFYIDDPRLKDRMKVYRESNIEHKYYYNLFKVDHDLKNKLYYLVASMKLRLYQKVLKNANLMLTVSQKDTDYLKRHFPGNTVLHLPSFHANSEVVAHYGKGFYALYHGNIEVPENEHAAKFLASEVFNDGEISLIIAGMNPRERLRKLLINKKNIQLIANPDDDQMLNLIREAHVNILVTFQATGLKLKLLNTLYNGRFCLVNNAMIEGTALEPLCVVANSAGELKDNLQQLFKREFGKEDLELRESILMSKYDNRTNGEILISQVFKT